MLYREYIITEEYAEHTVVRSVVDEDGRDIDTVRSEEDPGDAQSVSVDLGAQAIRPFTPRSKKTYAKTEG